jgi:hypothetical protein
MAPFLQLLPGIALQRGECALKEGIVNDVAFPIFPLHDPVSTPHMAETKIGGNRLILFALRSINQQGPACSKRAHESSAGMNPTISIPDPKP